MTPRSRGASRYRVIAGASSAAVVAGLLPALMTTAGATHTGVVHHPPQFPRNVVVFPERDFVEAEGFGADQRLQFRVMRPDVQTGAGVQIGGATATTGPDGGVEVNHPGGACWDGVTPDLIGGDEVQALTDPTTGEAATTQHVSAEHAYLDGTRVVVRGVASDGDGGRLPIERLEQRIINPAFNDTDVGRRDVRAVSDGTGHGLLTYDEPGDPTNPNWTAVYSGALFDAEVRQLAIDGQTRVLAWQAVGTDTAGGPTRQGLTIYEEDEINGPGMPECPPSASWAVTGSSPRAVNVATADQDLTVTGTSYGSSGVTVTLDDADPTTAALTASATPSAGPGAQTWSATFTSTAVLGLADGRLTASATYAYGDPAAGGGTIGGSSHVVLKDLVAPAAPAASPPGGTYPDPQSVALSNAEGLPMHFTVDGTEPGGDDPAHTAPLQVTADQTLRAVVVDAAGNPSPVSVDAYQITGARAGDSAPAAAATPDPLPAARDVQQPPVAPENVVVFPERDFLGVEGFPANSLVAINVLRNGALVGTARGRTDSTGFVEVNHPGGVCWDGVTPDIRSGDVVEVLKDTTPGHEQGARTTVAFVSITQAAYADTATGDVVVHGTAHDGSGNRVDLGNLEQRIINPALQDQPSVDSRHVSAVSDGSGEGALAYDGETGTAWTARFSGYSATVDQLLVEGQSRIMSWQAFTADERRGLTIWEHGEVNGPGMAECPGAAEFAVTASTPGAINIANAGGGLTLSGTANDATTVSAKLTDGTVTETAPAALAGSGASQTWTATFTSEQIAMFGSDTETLTASADYTAAAPVLGTVDLPILKDLTAPAMPNATPGGALYNSLQSVTLSNPSEKALAIHYTLDNTNPHADDPAYGGQIDLTQDTTLRAVAIDTAGNESAQRVEVYEFVGIAAPTIALAASSDTGSSPTDGITNDTTPTFSGTGPDGMTISLRAGTTEVGSGVVANGVWEITASAQPAGTASYTAVAVSGGREVASDPVSVTIDTTAPTTTITSAPASPTKNRDASFAFSASETGSTFKCSLSTGTAAFEPCISPAYTALADGAYTFQVQAVDVAGNSGSPVSKTLTVDNGAPMATAPAVALRVPGTPVIGTSSVPVQLRWGGSDDLSGVAAYQLQSSADGTTWTNVGTAGTGTTRDLDLALGTHRYRVTATDGAGNVSAPASSSFTLTVDQETATAKIAYVGTWTQANQTGSSGGAVRHASANTARATYTFSGTSVEWISTRGRDRGRADVYLDGVRVAQNVDLYRADSSPQTRYIAYRVDGLAPGTHTLQVHVLGTRNANSRGTRVDVDAFVSLQ